MQEEDTKNIESEPHQGLRVSSTLRLRGSSMTETISNYKCSSVVLSMGDSIATHKLDKGIISQYKNKIKDLEHSCELKDAMIQVLEAEKCKYQAQLQSLQLEQKYNDNMRLMIYNIKLVKKWFNDTYERTENNNKISLRVLFGEYSTRYNNLTKKEFKLILKKDDDILKDIEYNRIKKKTYLRHHRLIMQKN
jgi:hypothetical protein